MPALRRASVQHRQRLQRVLKVSRLLSSMIQTGKRNGPQIEKQVSASMVRANLSLMKD